MSDRDDQDDLITNPETRRRRAWIERAVQGVRRRLDSGEGLPEAARESPRKRPKLYVVRHGRER